MKTPAEQMWEIIDAVSADLRMPDDRDGMLARLRNNGLRQTASELEATHPA